MEARILRILAPLGLPGLALGVFYLLLRQFGFQFSVISPATSGVIAILFLLIVGTVTLYTIIYMKPDNPVSPSRTNVTLRLKHLLDEAERLQGGRETYLAWAAEVGRLIDALCGEGPHNTHSEAYWQFHGAESQAEKIGVLRAIMLTHMQ